MTKFVPKPSIIHYIGIIENVDNTILNYPLESDYRFEKLEWKLLSAIANYRDDIVRTFGYRPNSHLSHDRLRDVFCIRRDYADFGTHFYPKTSHRVEKLRLELTLRLIRLTTSSAIYLAREYQVASIDNELTVSSYGWKSTEFHQDDKVTSLYEPQIQYSKRIIDKVLAKSVAKNDGESEKKLKTMLEHPFFHPTCDLAFQNYELSFTVKNSGLAFLALITTLEVLFGSGAHRVARNAAVLLGNSKDEAFSIYDHIRTLHDKRSKFLHSGKIRDITQDDVLVCRDYCRKCIVEVFELYQPKEKLLKILNTLGFGDRPVLSSNLTSSPR